MEDRVGRRDGVLHGFFDAAAGLVTSASFESSERLSLRLIWPGSRNPFGSRSTKETPETPAERVREPRGSSLRSPTGGSLALSPREAVMNDPERRRYPLKAVSPSVLAVAFRIAQESQRQLLVFQLRRIG